ncbi:MAG: anthranilate synthase component I, partial [Hyphomicrobiaceae bacterium]|nr:anthranilate synthase component I [Hyphomicrobiaceae bacterium]
SLAAAKGSSEIESDHQPGEFAAKVEEVIKGTERGDYFEVVLSQRFSTSFHGSPTSLFKRLAAINPSPYMFLLNFGSEQLVGASPELFVRVTGKRYETCPIAGTVPRGATALEDADQVRQLIGSNKDESELTMCTDVDRNDMARVCVPGSVRIIGRRQLEFYSHLIHTVDHVEGTLREEFDSLDAFQTHMWACTVTGAPKPAALQAIEDLENSPRGWYSGAVGFISFNGDINTGITLRTARLKDGRADLRAGATLLYGSDPTMEEEETRTKAAAFLAALAGSGDTPHARAAAIGEPKRIRLQRERTVLLVDCRDSFVHNLASYVRELGAKVVTLRAGFPLEMIDSIRPDLVFLSPGPATPEDFGIPKLVGELVERKLPIFGVCLGHQGIGQHFGAELAQLPIPEHGKASRITHSGGKLFTDVATVFEAGRYHSLYLRAATMPDCLRVTAETTRVSDDGTEEVIPMAIEHRTLPIGAVQFHPESLMTLKQQTGHLILRNALENLT